MAENNYCESVAIDDDDEMTGALVAIVTATAT